MLLIPIVANGLGRRWNPVESPDEATLLRTAVQQFPVSVLLTDAEGRMRYVNPAFPRITGYQPEEALGSTPRMLKSGAQPRSWQTDDRAKGACAFRRLSTGEPKIVGAHSPPALTPLILPA